MWHTKGQMTTDVTHYLGGALPELNKLEVSDEEKHEILETLRERATGNFLWASLMVRTLYEEASSLMEIKHLIDTSLPASLDDYYFRIFRRFEKSQRPLVWCVIHKFMYHL
jgi:hypothetical protein